MFALALYTVLESLRDKVYLGFLVVMAILTVVFILAGSTPWGLNNFVVDRLGWMTIDWMLALQTSIYAVSNIYREREKKIVYNHLTLPLGRWQYLAGKGLGLLAVTALLAVMGTVILVIGGKYLSFGDEFRVQLGWLVASVLMKNAILLAFALLLSQIATSALTASLFTLGIFLAGNGANEILAIAGNLSGAGAKLITYIYYVIPNLKLVDFEAQAIYQGHVNGRELLASMVYSFSYTSLAFYLACVLFRRKDL